MQDHVTKSHDVGTIQYIEWLILNDRVQPSFIAGVLAGMELIVPDDLPRLHTGFRDEW